MGNCISITEPVQVYLKHLNETIDQQLSLQEKNDSHINKLLLLGPANSGKSTILKQMRRLYGAEYSEDERREYSPIIISNLIEGMKSLVSDCNKLNNLSDNHVFKNSAKRIMKCSSDAEMTQRLALAISILWQDKNIQKMYNSKKFYPRFNCYKYFAKALTTKYPRWGGPDWIPSTEDIIRSHTRDSSIVQSRIVSDGITFDIYDVSGQRNKKNKWVHCFEHINAVIFVVSISEFDEVPKGGDTHNSFAESVELFGEICNSPWFIDITIILFLNQKDLFKKKFIDDRIELNASGLRMFNSWKPLDRNVVSEEKALSIAYKWILKQFTIQRKHRTEIYHYFTCATDVENLSTVFNSCKDIVLRHKIRATRFMR